MDDVIKKFFENQDLKYKEFNDKIINTKYETIGVRMPIIKQIAKDITKQNKEDYIEDISPTYYESVLLKGLLIANIKDTKLCLTKLNSFLDSIDAWSICDTVCAACKCFKKDPKSVLSFVSANIHSNNFWRVRFAFVTLLYYFVKKEYLNLIFSYCDSDKTLAYYVMMAKSWLLCECYVKYPKETLCYLNNARIDNVTFNKAISKICDSYRVSKEAKESLKKMKKIILKA